MRDERTVHYAGVEDHCSGDTLNARTKTPWSIVAEDPELLPPGVLPEDLDEELERLTKLEEELMRD